MKREDLAPSNTASNIANILRDLNRSDFTRTRRESLAVMGATWGALAGDIVNQVYLPKVKYPLRNWICQQRRPQATKPHCG
jgi:hypothetical protein